MTSTQAAQAGPAPLAFASGLAKFYGPRLVFKEVTFALQPGQCLLLAGPNGAGKSTLLHVLAGLAEADAGDCGLGVGHEGLGFLGHVTCLYPQMTGLENLRFWSRIHGLSLSNAELLEKLDAVGLAHAAEDRAGTYSRGMAQRLNLARVFLNNPKLLMLDEPGTGLDVASTAVLTLAIRSAKARGAGIIWISHHLERDLEEADIVLALSGKGAPSYHGPTGGYTPETCLC